MKKIAISIVVLFLLSAVPLYVLAQTSAGSAVVENSKQPNGVAGFLKTGDLKSIEEKSGIAISLLTIFIAGFLLSFTPCIYPMIPITLGIIGARSQGKPFKGFTLSLTYVLGISVIFSIFGLAASYFGTAFGSMLQSKPVLIFLTALFFIMALSMFGMFEIQLPGSFASGLRTKSERGGYIGAFLLGIAAGVVASPCSSPVLVGMIAYVAQLKNPFLGFLYFFVFAWGLGILFLALGTFPALLTSIPKAGGWMVEIKNFFGLMLLAAAFYFLHILLYKYPLFFMITTGSALIILSVFTGAFYQINQQSPNYLKFKKSVGLVFFILGVLFFFKVFIPQTYDATSQTQQTSVTQKATSIAWIRNIEEGKKTAGEQKKPVFIDFYADWCVPCKEMDSTTFKDPRIIEESARFIALKSDNTEPNEGAMKLLKEHGLQPAFPTIIFYDSTGNFNGEATAVGYKTADELLKLMQMVK